LYGDAYVEYWAIVSLMRAQQKNVRYKDFISRCVTCGVYIFYKSKRGLFRGFVFSK